MSEQDTLKVAEPSLEAIHSDDVTPVQSFLSNTAREHNIWLVGGTTPLVSDTLGKVRSACLLFNDQGEQVARYDKIHLFDIDFGEQGGAYNESSFTEAGDQVVVVDTPFGKLGLAICYDLRFPELFREMTSEGMEILALASSFTATTGKAHWDCLLYTSPSPRDEQ